jgi:hypothetical protein
VTNLESSQNKKMLYKISLTIKDRVLVIVFLLHLIVSGIVRYYTIRADYFTPQQMSEYDCRRDLWDEITWRSAYENKNVSCCLDVYDNSVHRGIPSSPTDGSYF